jgi:uncharacterized membrane protein YdjX (TVP38/TMEM64 family)
MSGQLKPILLLLFVGGMLLTITILPVGSWLSVMATWVESHRTFAWIIYIAAYTAASILIIPGTILTLAAGFIFGIPTGIFLVSLGSLTGAASAFIVSRFLARDWVSQRIKSFPSFRVLDKATRHKGFIIVLLARLSPLFPFNLLNYAFGLTAVRFRDYVLASWIGMAPAIVLYVYVGSVAENFSQLTANGIGEGTERNALLITGLVTTLILTVLIARMATRALTQHLKSETARDPINSNINDSGND